MTVFGYVVHCLTQTAKLDDSHPIFLDKKPAKRKMVGCKPLNNYSHSDLTIICYVVYTV